MIKVIFNNNNELILTWQCLTNPKETTKAKMLLTTLPPGPESGCAEIPQHHVILLQPDLKFPLFSR